MVRYLFPLAICVFLMLSCSSDRQEGPEVRSSSEFGSATGEVKTGEGLIETLSGEYALRIRPGTGYANTVFRAYPRNFKASDARIEWLVNGEPAPYGEGREFQPRNASKGGTVQARAFLDDALVESDTVRIENSPPVIRRARILPVTFRPGDTLSIEPEIHDADGDEVTVIYEWIRNSEPAGDSKSIGVVLKRGDRVSVTITPYDGEAYGESATIERTIENMPPMIAEDNTFTFDGKVYAFTVNATDPDGDPLTYSLKSAPDGMYINKGTGDVTWDVPSDFTGEVVVIVAVSDGVRGESTREITLVLEEPVEETEEKPEE
ncbi:hypothetical protein EP227_00370 [bacterium]|nr:MAG: hypothetical protein EP227_00370 [bacterium]